MNGRALVLVAEYDGDETHIHGLVMAPIGMTDAAAHSVLTSTYEDAADAEEWNYGDVFDALKAKGFDRLEFSTWFE